MAKYTMELNELLSLGYHLQLDDYPIFSEDYRNYLNKKIINHFFFREIGQETPDRFNFMLRRKMHEIMPYYNKLYESELLKYDPLSTIYLETKEDSKKKTSAENDNVIKRNVNDTSGDTFSSNTDRKNAFKLEDTQDTTKNSNYKKEGDRTQDITSNELTTNNLKTETHTTSDSTGTNDTNGFKNTVFSDIPQAGVTTTTTTAPDGTVTTETTGYATTTTNETTREHSDTTAHQTSDSTSLNTGTVNVDGTSKMVENWSEKGEGAEAGNLKQNQNTTETTNTKEDSQRSIIANKDESILSNSRGNGNEDSESNTQTKGRSGFVPSELIMRYRKTLLNIDMSIINDLETLFMGVF